MSVVIPAEDVAALGWREHQRLSVKRSAGSIIIRDARTKRNFHPKKFLVLVFAAGTFLAAHKVSAASLYLTPSTGSYNVGSTITVTVKTNTAGEAVNTAEANLSYSATTLDLISVKQGSTFYLPAPGSPAKSGGSAYFGGGVPNPGYTGSAGNVGTMTFRAKAEGEATITITSGKVLLNDGFGTDALSDTSSAHFTIAAGSTAPPPASPTGEMAAPVVASATHPDQSKWYPAASVALSWTRPAGAYGFSFDLDADEASVPDNTLETTITTTKTYPDLADGVYYFHIKARAQPSASAFGPVATFKISIDTAKPKSFDINLAGNTISYETTDDLSGIDHYEIWVDGSKYRDTTASSLALNDLTGRHTVKVVAIDRAGNSQEQSLSADFAAPNLFYRSLTVPMYAILLSGLLLLILLSWVVYLLSRKNKKQNSGVDIERIQDEIDASLEDLKLQISKKLNSLSEASTEDLVDKETVVAKDIRSGIINTKKQIDNKLRRARKRKSQAAEPTKQEPT